MKSQTKVVNIGDTDENADWIKTAENRERERALHDELARKQEKKRQESK